MTYGLKPETIQAIQGVFANYPQIDKVILYGSRAKGNYRNGSDIDLVLLGKDIDLSLQFKIENELDDLLLPYKIDLSIQHKIENSELLDHIERVGKVFFEREEESEWQETEVGRIPLRWNLGRLEDICELITDGAHLSPKPQKSKNLMASVKDMRYNSFDFSDCKTISDADFDSLVNGNCSPQKNDILLSKDGANCLDIIFVYNQKEKIVLLSSIAIARLKNGFDPYFYRFYLLSPSVQDLMKNNYVSGSAIPRVILKDFKNVPVPIIPLTEQKAIASVLSSLDDKIDLLHRQNKTLEQMAETLFRQWFVEEAKEEWEEMTLKSLCKVITKGTTPTSLKRQFVEVGINFIKVNCIDDEGNFLYDKFNFIDEETHIEALKRSILQEGDLLYSIAGTIGRISEVTKEILPANVNQALAILRVNKDIINPYYIKYSLKDPNVTFDLHSKIVHAVQPNLSLGEIGSTPIPLPDIETRQKFNAVINPIEQKIKSNQTQFRTLEKLRDTLLPKLMSGEVTIEKVRA